MAKMVTIVKAQTAAATKTEFHVARVPYRLTAPGLATSETVDVFVQDGEGGWIAATKADDSAVDQMIGSGAKTTVLDVPGYYAVDKATTASAAGVYGTS
jgi:hypothetical protein